ncbi:hypothetical protein F5148DRAFT_1227158 [Russula earlei]|uniref:Uncharacterized protein n=1 Tax=Russula earlei TaxID=71964 RepID=A0ACC0U211_9AGAM|nr:hypothetical protein F5148DRAFT_1227158 [Russula earlei]
MFQRLFHSQIHLMHFPAAMSTNMLITMLSRLLPDTLLVIALMTYLNSMLSATIAFTQTWPA